MNAIERFEQKVARCPMSGCWLWLSDVVKKGYGRISVNGKPVKAHRFSWEAHHGPIPDGLHVLHSCDVPACVNPHHLFLGTNEDNVRDRERKGRIERALSDEVVWAIRRDNRPLRLIADSLGVSRHTAMFAKNGKFAYRKVSRIGGES